MMDYLGQSDIEEVSARRRVVVHVTSVHPWSDTRIFYRMCKGLARRGWEVHLVAPRDESAVVDSVHIEAIRAPRARVLRALVGGFRAVSKARSLAGDLYQLHDPELLLWAWYLRRTGKPTIYDMHEYVAGAIATRDWIPGFCRRTLRAAWSAVERLLLNNVPVVFAETSYSLHYRWTRNFAIVLNLPDVQSLLEIEANPGSSNRVVYIGSMTPARGSLTMLEAMIILRARGCEVELDLVGSASQEHLQELERFVAERKLENVHFHGYQRPADAWRIAKGATAGLAVLDAVPNYVESYPTKMFEYMALGIPVVASNFPLYKSVVEASDCGLCVPPNDPDSLADAIEVLLADAGRAERLGKNGRAAVLRSYCWEPELDKLEALYVRELGL